MAERSLRDEMPRIRRARGFRLYDEAGRRYLDLWQADGGAILGHRGAGAVTAVKAALDRGLAAPLPTAWERRLLAALAARFPAYRSFRLFATRERALRAAGLALGAPVDEADVADPALGSKGDGRVGLWRPYLPDEPPWPPDMLILKMSGFWSVFTVRSFATYLAGSQYMTWLSSKEVLTSIAG